MPYQYTFDHTPWGTLRLGKRTYPMVQRGLELLKGEIQTWNEKALQNGATNAPYQEEIADLERMIELGHEALANEHDIMVTFPRVSIGSLRYVKAGLVLMMAQRESEISEKVSARWPGGVIASLRQGLEEISRISQDFDVAPADILAEISVGLGRIPALEAPQWDVFIAHASEDKESFVRPLAEKLISQGLHVWFDEFTLRVGDSLRRSIDSGLGHSRFGIVVISPSFLAKEWPQRELDGLTSREADGNKVILPVWHEIGFEEVRRSSPILADRLAVKSIDGLDRVVEELLRAIQV